MSTVCGSPQDRTCFWGCSACGCPQGGTACFLFTMQTDESMLRQPTPRVSNSCLVTKDQGPSKGLDFLVGNCRSPHGNQAQLQAPRQADLSLSNGKHRNGICNSAISAMRCKASSITTYKGHAIPAPALLGVHPSIAVALAQGMMAAYWVYIAVAWQQRTLTGLTGKTHAV